MKYFLAVLLFTQSAPPSRLLLNVDEDTSGPLGGQHSKFCLRVYNDGLIYYGTHYTDTLEVKDEKGNITQRDRIEYRKLKLNDWEVSELADLAETPAFQKLADSYPPPIDYFSTARIVVDSGKVRKEIRTREFYVASVPEKAKYPSSLIALMDWINETETNVEQKGERIDILPKDLRCDLVFDSKS